MKLRKLNRSIHRDLGYIFFFLTVVYSISGIALNHVKEWNPSYNIKYTYIEMDTAKIVRDKLSRKNVIALVNEYTEGEVYKNHYFPGENELKIFIKDGNISVDLTNGEAYLETSKRRPILHEFNYLHYNPKKWWTTIADVYAIALFLLAVTGLFILKGKNGILRRGAWLTGIGILVPLIFLLLYYYKVF